MRYKNHGRRSISQRASSQLRWIIHQSQNFRGSEKIFQYFRPRPCTPLQAWNFPIPAVSPDMKILLILNPPCVQRFALTTIASPGSVVTISKHMHPFGAESITKPLKAIARRARWDYRAPENLSIIREGRDEKREREREREKEKDPSVRAKSAGIH
jgi:hypothetical protein